MIEKVVSLSEKTYKRNFLPLISRAKKIADKYYKHNIEFEDFLSIEGVEFNISMGFDDVFVGKTKNVFIMNLFFAEIEDIGNKDMSFVSQHFPSFIKLQNEIDKLRKDFFEYIEIGKNTPSENNLHFETFELFEIYTTKFNSLFDIYSEFLNEIENYLDSQLVWEISNTGIVSAFSNEGKKQTILMKSKTSLYKISILSESVEAQSYAKLFVKDNCGWTELMSYNPKRDFNIYLPYKKDIKKTEYQPIVSRFISLIEKIEK